METTSPPTYPVDVTVDYPDRDLNRVSSAFRIIWVIPILVILVVLSGDGGGLLFLPLVLMLVFRRKYPRWWFAFNRELAGCALRVTSYGLLLRDEYPSTDKTQAVPLTLPEPDGAQLNRWLPLVKWFLAIPHFIVLVFLFIGVVVVTIIAWFAILFTGRYPRAMHDYVVGVLRWGQRVEAYALLLVTDRYPPFRLNP